MSLLGGLGAMLGGAAMDQAMGWANSARAWHYKKKEMKLSDQMQRDYAHDAPGITRSGYEDANMNPMLAYSNSAASEAISASGVDSSGPSSGVSSAMQAMQLKQQGELNDSTIKLNEKTGIANTTNAIAALKNADTNSAKSRVDMENQTKETNARVAKLLADTNLSKEQRNMLTQQIIGQKNQNVLSGHSARNVQGIEDFFNPHKMSLERDSRNIYGALATWFKKK